MFRPGDDRPLLLTAPRAMLLALLLGLLTLLGHGAVWVFASNRLHATGLPHRLLQAITLVGHASCLAAAGLVAAYWWALWKTPGRAPGEALPPLAIAYALVCCLAAVAGVPLVQWQKWRARPPRQLLAESSRRHDLRTLPDKASGAWGSLVARLPFNESLLLVESRKELALARLDARLDGLRIAHLSDLHFTGRIGKAYFVEVFAHAAEMRCDLVAVTGDILDRNACLDWLEETFGQLRAPLGRYYVLGNHDVRVDHARLRQLLEELGWTHLGGKVVHATARDCPLVLAGNELPWFRQWNSLPRLNRALSVPRGAEISAADGTGGAVLAPPALKIALAHSPDQIHWAARAGVDLLLAGHLHGGQIRLPLVGPLLSPSRHGVKYACGTFHVPPTVMHVSRGISGKTPLRWRCPPEITELVLRPAQGVR